MGMDVYGKKPTAEVGEYFRNAVWSWHPLWEYVIEVAPKLVKGVDGHYNDGDGLNARASARLAAILTEELDSGRTAEYEVSYMAALDALADEKCELCSGGGVRSDAIGVAAGMVERGWCNGCDGNGKRRPHKTNYPFSASNVAAFRDFVAASGGFKIW